MNENGNTKEFLDSENFSLKNCPIYFVTDHQFTRGRKQLDIIHAALKGGIKLIQFRDKELSDEDFTLEAKAALELCHAYGALMLLNDRLEIAKAINADGVHLGQDDFNPLEARKILGKSAIIGFSTHNEKEVAAAQSLPIDYINIGPMFGTATKDHSQYPALGLSEVARLAKTSNLPVTTMGGIKKRHLAEIYLAGLTCAAMVTEISMAEDVEKTVKDLLAQFRQA